MLKDFALSFVFAPSRLRVVGILLSKLGFAIVIVGGFLQVGLKAIVSFQSVSRMIPANTRVENIFPGLPTWFIPESAEGFTFWLTVSALGLCCQCLAREIKRTYSWNNQDGNPLNSKLPLPLPLRRP